MIEINHVSKFFDGSAVLNDISLNLATGKTHVLIGSSGCGKSTLVRLLVGLTFSEKGSIKILGESMTPKNQPSLCRKIGYVIQEGGLFPHLSCRKNVSLQAEMNGWKKDRISKRLHELIGIVGLSDALLEKPPSKLSGGQRQRVSLMRALMMDPDLLLLDEPLGALDPIIRAEVQTELKTIFNSLKKTVVIVTHDMGEAAFFGHTITLLEKGIIAQYGEFDELVSRPKTPFVTQFLNAQRSLLPKASL